MYACCASAGVKAVEQAVWQRPMTAWKRPMSVDHDMDGRSPLRHHAGSTRRGQTGARRKQEQTIVAGMRAIAALHAFACVSARCNTCLQPFQRLRICQTLGKDLKACFWHGMQFRVEEPSSLQSYFMMRQEVVAVFDDRMLAGRSTTAGGSPHVIDFFMVRGRGTLSACFPQKAPVSTTSCIRENVALHKHSHLPAGSWSIAGCAWLAGMERETAPILNVSVSLSESQPKSGHSSPASLPRPPGTTCSRLTSMARKLSLSDQHSSVLCADRVCSLTCRLCVPS